MAVFAGICKDMEELMREHSTQGAAGKRFPRLGRIADRQRRDGAADAVAFEVAEREHLAVTDLGGSEHAAFALRTELAEEELDSVHVALPMEFHDDQIGVGLIEPRGVEGAPAQVDSARPDNGFHFLLHGCNGLR